MKTKYLLQLFLISTLIMSCSSSVTYSEDFKTKTTGKYLFNADDIIEISYDENTLKMNWRGIEKIPVATDSNEFFVADMYQKMHFVSHPETGKLYLSAISETKPDSIRYDYIKVSDSYKTPSQYIEAKQFDKALEGLQKIKAEDSLSDFINQYKFNRIGYKYMREENYDDAIAIFKMNADLHPKSDNVYDSLAEAYLKIGDSTKAYENYKKVLSIDQTRKKAQRFVNTYRETHPEE